MADCRLRRRFDNDGWHCGKPIREIATKVVELGAVKINPEEAGSDLSHTASTKLKNLHYISGTCRELESHQSILSQNGRNLESKPIDRKKNNLNYSVT